MSVHTPPAVPTPTAVPVRARARRSDLLAVATEVLVVRPNAALGEVAHAAGIGRTTLHKQYPTRDDLLVAVAYRALDQLHAAVDAAALSPESTGPDTTGPDTTGPDTTGPDTIAAALERLVTDFVPLGPELVFLLRQPTLDDASDLWARFDALQEPIIELVHQGQRVGLLRKDFPDPWFVSTMYAQTYVAWEGVAAGWLAPLDAPGLVQRTLLEGICGDAGVDDRAGAGEPTGGATSPTGGATDSPTGGSAGRSLPEPMEDR